MHGNVAASQPAWHDKKPLCDPHNSFERGGQRSTCPFCISRPFKRFRRGQIYDDVEQEYSSRFECTTSYQFILANFAAGVLATEPNAVSFGTLGVADFPS